MASALLSEQVNRFGTLIVAGGHALTTYRIGLAAGDGIGPEISSATHTVIDAACKDALVSIDWVEAPHRLRCDRFVRRSNPGGDEERARVVRRLRVGSARLGELSRGNRERRNPSGELCMYFRSVPPTFGPRGRTLRFPQSAHEWISSWSGEYGGFYTDRNMYV